MLETLTCYWHGTALTAVPEKKKTSAGRKQLSYKLCSSHVSPQTIPIVKLPDDSSMVGFQSLREEAKGAMNGMDEDRGTQK